MSRLEFLAELEKRISALPNKDIKKATDYYGEMLEDYEEDGLDTDAAISKMGGIEQIVSDILSEAEGQDAEDNGEKFNTGAATGAFRVLKTVLFSLVLIGIFITLTVSAALAVATVVTLIDGVISLFSESAVLAIFTLGSALVFGAISLISAIGGIYLIKYSKKILIKKQEQPKGENKNDIN